ncbi:hypothetical protein [Cellulomonas sp. NPDC089187]|uniref:hypothetical protein n=1 Tax=Cellulomonas sp. NPDC089187 TaxID=3154970 RepID=UPI003432D35C
MDVALREALAQGEDEAALELLRAHDSPEDTELATLLLGVIVDPTRDDLLRQEAIIVVALSDAPVDSGAVVDAFLTAAEDDSWWPTQVEGLERLGGRPLDNAARDRVRAIAEDDSQFELVRESARRLL